MERDIMTEKFVCPICGEPTSSYMGKYRKDRLCRKHANDLKNGIIKIENIDLNVADNAKVDADKREATVATQSFCVVCGMRIKNKYKQCADCYQETKEYMGGLDKNSTISEFRQYYFNLKDYIFRMKDFERVKTNCNKLIAIAMADNSSNDDNALLERAYRDVQELIEKKQKLDTENAPKEQGRMRDDKNKETEVHFYYSTDGHALDSDMEVKIDDILYASEIFHCCHKPVIDITEKSVRSDWFIPIDSINKGIYIEYNGMDTPKYKKNKEENIALYRQHKLPLIIIEKDEPKKDTQTFTANLIKDIQTIAIECFGGMPKWKKERS